MTNPTEFLVQMVALLERLGIVYHVGGSVASSAHGMPPSRLDVTDLLSRAREKAAEVELD